MKPALPILLALAAAVSLSACASDGDMWGHHDHDYHDGDRHDGDRHDGDRHDGDPHGAVGAMLSPSVISAPVVAQG